MSQSTLMICNPGSRSGNNPLQNLRERLAALGEVEFRQPDHPGQIPELIREHGPNSDRIVLGGGDGTINLALDALLEVDRPLGILPLGTANDLARSLGLPVDLERAMDVIVLGQVRRIDVAKANDVTFINAIGMGLGPRMTQEMDSEEKSRFGILAYLLGILRALRGQRHFKARIDFDGKTRRYDCLQVTVANGIHYGGGMTIADDAKIDDGKLDVLVVSYQGYLRLLASSLRLRSGNMRAADTVHHFRCRSASITTQPDQEVTADGEFRTQTPVECQVGTRSLQVITPE
ncbi:lipid kinase [Wenzhouxiangella sp. AB-CW3]|uniref:lipid kinase n=1 Tax=Wenzhouxiangella sp. AB-CW3 TaxID=2771012 RepID=UPI00168A5168|nr:lipid kinase [Wenzhouxiangella sp. AB-CW3]QOC21455.1 lipid kinase [Wenzhouxiangella sp. AB-CW3]